MTTTRIAFLGYGNVNRALHALIDRRRHALAAEHDIVCEVVGISTRRDGYRVGEQPVADIGEWLDAAKPDVVFEAIPLDRGSGRPALDYLRRILEHGAHAISANKGPVVFGFRELQAIAERKGRAYRFEAAVMDGAPVFSLVRDTLPLAGVRRIRGIFTSTANVVLDAIGRGASMDDGIAEAQAMGIAEADPSYDIDGWDTTMKLCALANALFGGDLRPNDVERVGVRHLSTGEIRAAEQEGSPYRLVGDLRLGETITARVRPVRCTDDDPLGIARGATLVMHYDAEVFPGGLTVTSRDPDPTTTAFGMLTDFIATVAGDGA